MKKETYRKSHRRDNTGSHHCTLIHKTNLCRQNALDIQRLRIQCPPILRHVSSIYKQLDSLVQCPPLYRHQHWMFVLSKSICHSNTLQSPGIRICLENKIQLFLINNYNQHAYDRCALYKGKVAHLVGPLLVSLISLQPISSYNFGTSLSADVVLSLKIVIKTKQPTINTVFEFILKMFICWSSLSLARSCVLFRNRCVQFVN